MLARRTKIFHQGQFVAETPLLIPSFSSKGFPDESQILKFMSGFITSGILVSAYDLKYKKITQQRCSFAPFVFLDSGGYEARVDYDLSEAYGKPYRPRKWNKVLHERQLNAWRLKVPTVAVTYDSPTQYVTLGKQLRDAARFQEDHPEFLTEFLIKPERRPLKGKQTFIPIEKLVSQAERLRRFPLLGVTEKELGASILTRMVNVARLRGALDGAKIDTPLHIFGSLDTMTTILYFVAGAEIFDGLTWLRFGFHMGRTMYYQNYSLAKGPEGIHRGPEDQFSDMWKQNWYYLEKLRAQMINCAKSKTFVHFGDMAEIAEDAWQQLEARLPITPVAVAEN